MTETKVHLLHGTSYTVQPGCTGLGSIIFHALGKGGIWKEIWWTHSIISALLSPDKVIFTTWGQPPRTAWGFLEKWALHEKNTSLLMVSIRCQAHWYFYTLAGAVPSLWNAITFLLDMLKFWSILRHSLKSNSFRWFIPGPWPWLTTRGPACGYN